MTLLAFDELQLRQLSHTVRATAMVFEDPVSRKLLEHIERIAPSDATVLIIGETGTGKELVARHVHALSKRAKGPFGALNCAALSENLIESELFGHEKGAFTGALNTKDGWFETANKGSLFLDEVGDLPLGLQAKLLRVLQEREVVKVGSRTPSPVDVRVIAATNVNLEEAVAASHFRADLYYRFNVAAIHLSPLRERPGDILPLARHFLKVYGDRLGYGEIKLSPSTELALLNYDWPGNIRELENALERGVLFCKGNELTSLELDQQPVADKVNDWNTHKQNILTQAEQAFLKQAMQSHRGDVKQVADAMGLTPRAVYGKLKRYGINSGQFR